MLLFTIYPLSLPPASHLFDQFVAKEYRIFCLIQHQSFSIAFLTVQGQKGPPVANQLLPFADFPSSVSLQIL